jgi:hypothetical protein
MSIQKINAVFKKAGLEKATQNRLGWNRGFVVQTAHAPDHHATVRFSVGGTRMRMDDRDRADIDEHLAKAAGALVVAGLAVRRQGDVLLVSHS